MKKKKHEEAAPIEAHDSGPVALGCQHGRAVGVPCPHCLGVGASSLELPASVSTYELKTSASVEVKYTVQFYRKDGDALVAVDLAEEVEAAGYDAALERLKNRHAELQYVQDLGGNVLAVILR